MMNSLCHHITLFVTTRQSHPNFLTFLYFYFIRTFCLIPGFLILTRRKILPLTSPYARKFCRSLTSPSGASRKHTIQQFRWFVSLWTGNWRIRKTLFKSNGWSRSRKIYGYKSPHRQFGSKGRSLPLLRLQVLVSRRTYVLERFSTNLPAHVSTQLGDEFQ